MWLLPCAKLQKTQHLASPTLLLHDVHLKLNHLPRSTAQLSKHEGIHHLCLHISLTHNMLTQFAWMQSLLSHGTLKASPTFLICPRHRHAQKAAPVPLRRLAWPTHRVTEA